MTPGTVIEPADARECAALLAECSARGWSVEVGGGGSARGAGRPPERVDVLLSTARMAGIGEYEPNDLTIEVAAGTPVVGLGARVAAAGQRVPLDVSAPGATVGGVLARAAAGPMRRAWGTPRRQVLGIELVTGDGRILRVGGRVVKNVAGYDLNKLIVGSAGTLGVITRAHLRLLPAPVATAAVVVDAATRAAAIAVCRLLLDAPVPPAALELIGSAGGTRRPDAAGGAGRESGPDAARAWRVAVRFEGGTGMVEAGVRGALETAHAAGAAVVRPSGGVEDMEGGEEVDGAADAQPSAGDAGLSVLSRMEAEAAILVRVADRAGRLDRTLETAERIAEAAGTQALVAAHAGDGIARVIVARDAGSSGSPGDAANSVDIDGRVAMFDIRAIAAAVTAERAAGSTATVIVERGPRDLMLSLDPWGPVAAPVLRIIRELKLQFDPAGILQPGRWLA